MRLREIKPGMVIHCKTEEEAKILLAHLKNKGIRWAGDTSMDKTIWENYLHNTCYAIYHDKTLRYSDKKHFEMVDREITEFSDLIIPELSPAEVLKICNEICHEEAPCNDCKMAGNCFFEKDSDYQKVVEICEQWKADHEKKEPEVEWVDICRIIEVQDNGFKKCVHEVDIKDADLPFGYKECTTEMILKEYMKSHSGNYFATVEHVCRVKGEK